MAKRSKQEASDLIQPIIRVDGQKHVLENILAENPEEMPVMKSVGFMKIHQDRQHSWVSYVITTKGKEVLSIEVSEPDMREVSEESAKISFVNCFVDQVF